MRILKLSVLTVLGLSFASLSSAEMAGMSLQERVRQSDAVVVGTIEEVRQTDAGVAGQFPPPVTHWLATCRVERYIIGPKIHNPAVEEAKAVHFIHVAFWQRLQKPTPVKLVAGKKYLLFLVEVESQPRGKIGGFYGMITPYHGAFEAGQEYFVHDENDPSYPQAVKMSFDEIVQRLTQENTAPIDIRHQLDSATGYWYAYLRGKAIGDGKVLRNVHTEGEWTLFEVFGHHGWSSGRVLTRFLKAEEAKTEGVQLTLNGIKAGLRSTIPSEVEEGIREIETLTGLSLKDNVCSSPEKCLRWIENNEDYFLWNAEESILIPFQLGSNRKPGGLVRGLHWSIMTDKTVYKQNEPIIVTARLENSLPASAEACSVFPVNARMLIHFEIDFDVRNEEGGLAHFALERPPALAVKDFKMLEGGQSIETQEELTSRLHDKPLAPGRYRIKATYQNYELTRCASFLNKS